MKPKKKETTAFCVKKLRVLADQTRLSVLKSLMAGPMRVNELQAALGMEQSLLSHHLKVLRDEALVDTSREGKSILYRISADAVAISEHAINLGCCTLSFDQKGSKPTP